MVNPKQMGGVPCIRGLRIPGATVVGMVADGMTVDEALHRRPRLVPASYCRAAERAGSDGLCCAIALRGDSAGHAAWRAGGKPPPFRNCVQDIGRISPVAAVEASIGNPALFSYSPDGVMADLYADVCRYAHSRPGFTTGDLAKSNLPVFVGSAFTQFWLDYCDTLLACYVLFKIGYSALRLPKSVKSILAVAGTSWHDLAPAAVAAYFP